jgi:DUF1680 family protein
MPERITPKPFELASGVFGVLQGHTICGFELCEAVGNLYWNWRMLGLTGQCRYADLFERMLYNGFLSHVSLDGSRFHYLSPLASDGDFPPRNNWGHPETGCCPPNALRMMASLPGYFFGTSDQGLWVHLYDSCLLETHCPDGTPLQVKQKTCYPWYGQVTLELFPKKETSFSLFLRIPGWCEHAEIKINGRTVCSPCDSGTYCQLQRVWQNGDTVTLEMPMPIRAMAADSRAHDFYNKIALMRGPLVYCFEGCDNADLPVWDIHLPLTEQDQPTMPRKCLYYPIAVMNKFNGVFEKDFLNGVIVLDGFGYDRNHCKASLRAIPYYAWHNRATAPMRVWISRG